MGTLVSFSSLRYGQDQEKKGTLGTEVVMDDKKPNDEDWSALHMLVEVSCRVSQEGKKGMCLSSLLRQQVFPKKQRSPPRVRSPQMTTLGIGLVAIASGCSSDHQENRIIDCKGLGRKRKLSFVCDEDKDSEKESKKKKRRTMMKMNMGLYQPPPDLPEEYKKMVNGAKAELVIQKQLFTSDIKPDQNRLTLPWKQILCKEFLRPNEIESLELPKTFLKVSLIDPKLEKEVISVGLWQFSSSEEKTVVLYSNWNKIVTKNGLVRGDLIQIWSFRDDEDRLQLALVVLKRGGKCENGVVERAEKRENGVEGRSTAGSGSVSNVSVDSAGASHQGRTCLKIRFKCNASKSESSSTSHF